MVGLLFPYSARFSAVCVLVMRRYRKFLAVSLTEPQPKYTCRFSAQLKQ